jgi:hypothetical protein
LEAVSLGEAGESESALSPPQHIELLFLDYIRLSLKSTKTFLSIYFKIGWRIDQEEKGQG